MRIAMDAKTGKKYKVVKQYNMRGMFFDRISLQRYDLVKVYI